MCSITAVVLPQLQAEMKQVPVMYCCDVHCPWSDLPLAAAAAQAEPPRRASNSGRSQSPAPRIAEGIEIFDAKARKVGGRGRQQALAQCLTLWCVHHSPAACAPADLLACTRSRAPLHASAPPSHQAHARLPPH